MNDTAVNELAPVYRFLGQLWLHEPSSEILATWQKLQPVIPFTTRENSTFNESLDELHVEFCRLFIGPQDHLPPYQSVWQTGQMGGPANISMERYLERSEFDRQQKGHRIPADHLGLQLDLFGWLLEQHSPHNQPEADTVLQEFYAAHLMWPDELLSRVEVASQSDFYRQLAVVTRALLDQITD